jgi:hypothetical protein
MSRYVGIGSWEFYFVKAWFGREESTACKCRFYAFLGIGATRLSSYCRPLAKRTR